MKILKYPNKTGFGKLHIKHKCSCGLKVLIESMKDICYIRQDLGDIVFGYVCPNCEKVNTLSEWRNCKICAKIESMGMNIDKYRRTCSEINRKRHWELQLYKNHDEYNDIIQQGVPLPIELYKVIYGGK